jgi:hypothetical protein
LVAVLWFGDGDKEDDTVANQANRVGSSGGIGGGTSGSHRGFAGMDQAKQREIASKGGSASGGNFANNPERAREAGRRGGEVSGGNFARDPRRAAEAGRKGGEASRGGGHRAPADRREKLAGSRDEGDGSSSDR